MTHFPHVLAMADPFSWTAFFIALGASAASTGASLLAAHIFQKKPKPQMRGKLQGDLYVQNGEPGAVIKKFAGGDPGDGQGCGVLTAGEVLWMSKVRKVVTTTHESAGGKGGLGGGHTQEVQSVNYYVDIAVMFGFGPLDFFEVRANNEVVYNAEPAQVGQIFEAEDATLGGLAVSGALVGASNGRGINLGPGGYMTGTAAFSMPVAVGGARTLRLYYSAVGAASIMWQLNGGAQTALALPATGSPGTFATAEIAVTLNSGDNTFTLIANGGAPYFDYVREIPQNDARTGMLYHGAPPDPNYTQDALPAAGSHFRGNVDRWNELPPPDEFGASGGTIHGGGYAGLRLYAGTPDQLPDPTIEQDVDGRLGEGSTPAYRNKGYMMAENFSITKFGGTIPVFMARVAHQTIKTMKQLMERECSESGVSPADVDFSSWSKHKIRGHVITTLQSGRQTHDTLARAFNTKIVETDGKLLGVTLGEAAPVAVDENDLGMIDEGRAPDGDNNPLRKIDVTYGTEATVARTTNLKYFSPAKKYESNNLSYDLLDVASSRVEQIDLPMVFTDDEAQAIVIREAYKTLLESTEGYNLNLPYKHRGLFPTRTLAATADGVSYLMRITTLNAAPGRPMELTAVPEDVSHFTQVLRGADVVGDVPLVPIPAMTIGALIDSVLMRDGDETNNNGVGFYAAARRRPGQGSWDGWALSFFRDTWQMVAQSDRPATMGVAANILPAGQTALFDDHPLAGENNYLDLDLFDDAAALESATEAECYNGKNVGIYDEGDRLELIQWKTATKLAGYANRWRLTGLRRGLRGTEYAVPRHVAGARFVLLNEAVVFVPMSLGEINTQRDWKFVTLVKNGGQSLTDAATISWSWLGATKRPLAPVRVARADDAAGNILITFDARTRFAGGIRDYLVNPVAEESQQFYIRFVGATREHVASVTTDDHPVVWQPDPNVVRDANNAAVDGFAQEIGANPVDLSASTLSGRLTAGFSETIGFQDAETLRVAYALSMSNTVVFQGDGTSFVTLSAIHDPAGTGATAVLGSINILFNVPDPSQQKIDVRIEIVDGVASFYAAVEGQAATPFARSEVFAPSRYSRLRAYRRCQAASAGDRLKTGRLQYVYTLAEQTRDYGGHVAPGSLSLQIWQESRVVGAGFTAEATV